MTFITEQDFDVQVRDEILSILQNGSDVALPTAELMAIDQIRQHIGGRYDTGTIFSQQGDNRDHYIVMITIDLMLYHLWSKKAPRRLPEYRSQRYQDALNWLEKVGTGKITAQLPQLNTQAESAAGVIGSIHKPSWNKY